MKIHLYKSLLLAAIVLLGSIYAHADFDVGKKAFLVNLGFTRGGMALGADYEYGADRSFGLGGYFRTYPKDKLLNGNGLTAVGAFIRPHFNRQSWDFYVSPGFGIISYQPAREASASLFGPSMAIGLLYELKPNMSLGIENMFLASWFGENAHRGALSEEILLKFRLIL